MKNKPMRLIVLLASLVLMLLGSSATPTMAAAAPDKAELKARFEKRYPQILEYKRAGKVGETMKGMIEAVESKYARDDDKLASLIEDENSDRRALYKLIAADEGVSPEKVAERMAERNYERARPGEYLKSADGKWKRKS